MRNDPGAETELSKRLQGPRQPLPGKPPAEALAARKVCRTTRTTSTRHSVNWACQAAAHDQGSGVCAKPELQTKVAGAQAQLHVDGDALCPVALHEEEWLHDAQPLEKSKDTMALQPATKHIQTSRVPLGGGSETSAVGGTGSVGELNESKVVCPRNPPRR
jgi:hypothetical protein